MKKLTPKEILAQILKDSDSAMQLTKTEESLNRKKVAMLYNILGEKSERQNKLINPNEVQKINGLVFEDYYLHGRLIMRLSKTEIANFFMGKTREITNLANG